MKNSAAFEAQYKITKAADDVFQAAVIRQFGRKNAGTMRYLGSKHNAETKAAAEMYWIEANRLVDIKAEAR
jgi:hypothetical protein